MARITYYQPYIRARLYYAGEHISATQWFTSNYRELPMLRRLARDGLRKRTAELAAYNVGNHRSDASWN